MNQWVDYNQACIDTLMKMEKSWLDFGDLDLFQGHTSTLFQILTKIVFPHAISWNNW